MSGWPPFIYFFQDTMLADVEIWATKEGKPPIVAAGISTVVIVWFLKHNLNPTILMTR
jgi:hypothetical protein